MSYKRIRFLMDWKVRFMLLLLIVVLTLVGVVLGAII